MMSKVIVVMLGVAIVCHMVASESQESHEVEEHLSMGGDLCMPHCSHICMHNGGKPETCLHLMNHSNHTFASLPNMASCPSNMTLMNDCFLKCGCQCTRCAVCFLRGFHVDAVTTACKAKPNPVECIHEKKVAVLKACK